MTVTRAFDLDIAMIALAASAALAQAPEPPLRLEQAFEGAADSPRGGAAGAVGGAFVVPVLAPEGVETGDARTFSAGSLTTRNLPVPLLWQIATAEGHDNSVVVGRIDSVETLETGGLGNARGVFDTGVYGREAERLVRGGFLRGISADLDRFEGSVEHADELPDEMADGDGDAGDDGGGAGTESGGGPRRERIAADKITVTTARLMAATLVPKPAFQESIVLMADDIEIPDSPEQLLGDGPYQGSDADAETIVASLAAFAAPQTPPRSWFDNPALAGPTPLTTTDDGRVYGHIATWNVHHIGLPTATPPPRSRSGYRYFCTGVLRADDGSDIPVGQLTLSGGHAAMSAGAAEAVKHYDDTASAVADVRTGEDAHGIWVAGSLRPGVTPEQVRVLRASAPSGDWRPIDGRLELVAVCQVNVPGFPVARAMVAGGQITALVACGARELAEMRTPVAADELLARLASVEAHQARSLLAERDRLRSPLTSLALARAARLSKRSAPARARLLALSAQRTQALTASAEHARARVTALRATAAPAPDAPGLHVAPRDTAVRGGDGRYRRVHARLSDLLAGVDGAAPVLAEVDAAASSEDSGAPDSGADARASITRAADALAALADDVEDPATNARLTQAQEVLAADPADPADGQSEGDAEPGADGGADTEPVDVDALVAFLTGEVVGATDPDAAVAAAPPAVTELLGGAKFATTAELAEAIGALITAALAGGPIDQATAAVGERAPEPEPANATPNGRG